ncbi:MAG: GntR family transcriptional regulator [Tissierellia bacterium]|nr:GntR family transcriptional regulator [Tissierellia bacterium]
MERKLEKKSLSHRVHQKLKQKILNNELLPGDKLIEMEIANDLGVSRTPVREALSKLEEEGLAKNFPRKSYIVSKISMKEAKNLYTVRAALEPLAIGLVAEKGLNKRTKELEEVTQKMKDAYEKGNLEALKDLIVQWNIAMVHSLNNDILKELMLIINERLYRFGNFIFRSEDNIIIVYQLLIQMYENIVDQNPEEASKTSKKLIDSIYPMLEEQSDYKMFRY